MSTRYALVEDYNSWAVGVYDSISKARRFQRDISRSGVALFRLVPVTDDETDPVRFVLRGSIIRDTVLGTAVVYTDDLTEQQVQAVLSALNGESA